MESDAFYEDLTIKLVWRLSGVGSSWRKSNNQTIMLNQIIRFSLN